MVRLPWDLLIRFMVLQGAILILMTPWPFFPSTLCRINFTLLAPLLARLYMRQHVPNKVLVWSLNSISKPLPGHLSRIGNWGDLHPTNFSETEYPTSSSTSRGDWPGVRGQESMQDLNMSLKPSFFTLHTTTSIIFPEYKQVKHHECLWGDTVQKHVPLYQLYQILHLPNLYRRRLFAPPSSLAIWNG